MGDDGETRGRVLDEALLRTVARRLGSLTLVEAVSVFPGEKPESVVARFDPRYYPERVGRVALELRVYTNGDFHVSYLEDSLGSVRRCRWDRHDQDHNTRDHVHPFPDASTPPAEDRDFPADVTTTLETVVLPWVDRRLGQLWEEATR